MSHSPFPASSRSFYAIPSLGDALVGASRKHTFCVNDDQVHCLRAVALNDASELVALLLMRKLALARLLHGHRMPLDVVALGATVEFGFSTSECPAASSCSSKRRRYFR